MYAGHSSLQSPFAARLRDGSRSSLRSTGVFVCFSFFGEVFSLAFRFSFDDFAFAARFTTLLTVEHAFESVASSGRKGFYAMMTRVMKEAREKENGMKTVT